MIDFSNKYLTIVAFGIILYLLSGSFSELKNLHSGDVSGKAAKYSMVIDPHKDEGDYTTMEKIALMNLPEKTVNKLEGIKEKTMSPKDLIIQSGDKVFIEVDFVNSEEKESVKAYNVKVGIRNNNLENFITDVLIGMRMNEKKIVENPENNNDIREINILYIERLKQKNNYSE